jgi:hypothetical protein
LESDAFNQLGPEDQKAAIDVAIAAVLIGLRISTTGKPLYDWMATEFAATHNIPPNVAKYALRSLGRGLTAQNWTLIINKDGEGVTTQFKPEKKENSEEP